MKKMIALVLSLMMALSLCVCAQAEEKTTFKIGICNFVDDASLNQIIANIREQLKAIEAERGVTFEIKEDNCNLDGSVMQQIIADFIAEEVDLMVGIATPVAMTMQGMTEDNQIPVVFAAVSDPVGAGLVESLEAPGANITGTSDYLDTGAVLNLIFAANPDASKIALLYNPSEDASTAPIAAAKEILAAKGVSYKEYSGASISEVMLAADAIVADGMDAVFTPTDNTIMAAELSIYEKFAEAKIPHYTGADSFALNGAFLGYGVDYANLGKETANMIALILLDKADIASTPVMTFDNGTATVNTETCAAIGFDYDAIAEAFAPLCTTVQPITTAESFDDL
ncbi:MAG: ABC transporter substrate-binding protein [Clostridia bacterium]|nr:ABC transporter substrate-binding protein [Clostridia bacterium]MBR6186361.1 ABC transporter substrate-binding protein [Clostridia bacterium]